MNRILARAIHYHKSNDFFELPVGLKKAKPEVVGSVTTQDKMFV